MLIARITEHAKRFDVPADLPTLYDILPQVNTRTGGVAPRDRVKLALPQKATAIRSRPFGERPLRPSFSGLSGVKSVLNYTVTPTRLSPRISDIRTSRGTTLSVRAAPRN